MNFACVRAAWFRACVFCFVLLGCARLTSKAQSPGIPGPGAFKVVLTQPVAGEQFIAPATVRIEVQAADPGGYAPWVEFFANEKKIGESRLVFIQAPPAGSVLTHTFDWLGVPAGRYALTAVAHNDRGGTASSAPVSIVVLAPGEVPVVTVQATDPEAAEPPDPQPNIRIALNRAQLTFFRTGALDAPLDVPYSLGGTARNGQDYETLPGVVTFPIGASNVVVDVLPINDHVLEPTETVVVGILRPIPAVAYDPAGNPLPSLPPPYSVGVPGSATVTILDNGLGPVDAPPRARITSPSSGSAIPGPADVLVEVETVDPDGWVPYVEFFAGADRIGESRIVFVRAPDPGTPLTHRFTWKAVAVGDYVLSAVAHDDRDVMTRTEPILLRVIPSGALPVVTVAATDPEAAEPTPVPPGMGLATRLDSARFSVTRDGSLVTPLFVRFHLEGTARNGVDYARVAREVQISAGAASAEVLIEPIDDDLVEGDETVVLVVDPAPCPGMGRARPHCYVIGKASTATAVIHDNDPNPSLPPRISIHAVDPVATEGARPGISPTATLLLHRAGPTNGAVEVGLRVAGSATGGVDYKELPSSITIPAGERDVRLRVIPVEDSQREGPETVVVELLPAPLPSPRPLGWPAYLLGRPSLAVAVILDNDTPWTPPTLIGDGMAALTIPVHTAALCQIEVSDDLETWIPIHAAAPVDGRLLIVDPAAGDGTRFYRAVEGTEAVLP